MEFSSPPGVRPDFKTFPGAGPGSNVSPGGAPGSDNPPGETPGLNTPPGETPGLNTPPSEAPGLNTPPREASGLDAPPGEAPGFEPSPGSVPGFNAAPAAGPGSLTRSSLGAGPSPSPGQQPGHDRHSGDQPDPGNPLHEIPDAGDPDTGEAPDEPGRNIPASHNPGLILVSTPIGNLGDLSPRALAALKAADAVLCEDTRVTAPMLTRHGVSASLVPLHDHNEDQATPRILDRIARGERLALVSDAGTPLMSDPGYRLVRAAIAAGVTISAVPGPNAAVMALTLSGLPPHPFLFMGFLPPRTAARAAELAKLRAAERAGLSATLVFYEAPHRLAETLAAMAEALGPRPAAVTRELTKRFEEVRRGPLPDLAAHYATHAARGEIALVVGPPEDETPAGEAELDTRLRAALATGDSLRDAAALVAAGLGLPRKLVYARALELRESEG